MLATNKFIFQTSKLYLYLSIVVYLLSFIAILIISPLLIIDAIALVAITWLFIDFYKKHILLTNDNSIKELILQKDEQILLLANGKKYRTNKFNCVFASSFLIILNITDKYLVVFKDSIKNNSIQLLHQIIKT